MGPENPKIDEKRSQAIKAMWDKLSPEDRISQTQSLREGRVKARQTRMVATLGDNPEATLKSMVEQGLSRAEIAMKLSKSEATIDYWLKSSGLHSGKSTTLGRDNIEYRRSLVRLATEAKLIEYLLPEDRKILEQRFLESGQVTPLEEIGKSFALTRQRVHQKEARALTVLEKMLTGEIIPKNGVATRRRAKKDKIDQNFQDTTTTEDYCISRRKTNSKAPL